MRTIKNTLKWLEIGLENVIIHLLNSKPFHIKIIKFYRGKRNVINRVRAI